jgi:hypothetical protein
VLYSYAHHNAVNKAVIADRGNQELIVKAGVSDDAINHEAAVLVCDPNGQWGPLVEAGLDNPNTVSVVKYEDMKNDPEVTACRALAQAGYEVSKAQEPPSWADLKSFAPQFYWRGRPGGYRNLDPGIVEDFETRNKQTLRRLGYK